MEKRIVKLEIILSTILLLMPLLLIAINQQVRSSISDYAYSTNNWWFFVLLTIAGMMFVYNGSGNNKRWYNIILGTSLIGVATTPHLDFPILHYTFAATFFLGSIGVMIIFSSPQQRMMKTYVAAVVVLGLIGHFAANAYSLLIAEWIGMLPICIHYIAESLGKID